MNRENVLICFDDEDKSKFKSYLEKVDRQIERYKKVCQDSNNRKKIQENLNQQRQNPTSIHYRKKPSHHYDQEIANTTHLYKSPIAVINDRQAIKNLNSHNEHKKIHSSSSKQRQDSTYIKPHEENLQKPFGYHNQETADTTHPHKKSITAVDDSQTIENPMKQLLISLANSDSGFSFQYEHIEKDKKIFINFKKDPKKTINYFQIFFSKIKSLLPLIKMLLSMWVYFHTS